MDSVVTILKVVGAIALFWVSIALVCIIFDLIKFVCTKAINKIIDARNTFITQNSILLRELQALNNSQPFVELQKDYSYPYECSSKQEFDRFDSYDYFCHLCYRNSKEFRAIKHDALENRAKYESYIEQYNSIISKAEIDGMNGKYRKAERKMLEEQKAHPVIDPTISIIRKYSSPKGQNRYRHTDQYSIDKIETAIKVIRDQYKANAKYKAGVEYERSLMTAKLRYEVLLRDGFKCCLCGAGAQDGAILHVDHIKPVSKGGKTELNNLRTLCDRCNLGKGSSYNIDGLN